MFTKDSFHSFTHLLIHSFNRYVLSTCLVPGTVFGAVDTLVKKMDKDPVFMELIFYGGRHTTNLQINM